MDKLDRLVWVAGFSFSAYGVDIGVRLSDPAPLEQIKKRVFLPGWSDSGKEEVDTIFSFQVGGSTERRGVKNYHLVYEQSSRVARTLDLEHALNVLEQSIHLRIGILSREHLFVHAGVVGWKGKAILLPGRTHAGKSTLVKALVDQGADFYSDEYAVFDLKGQVHAYPRALLLRTANGGEDRIPAHDLTGGRELAPLPVGMVVSSRYRSGAQWKPRKMTPGQTFLELFANTIPAMLRPIDAMQLFPNALQEAIAVRGTRGEAVEAAERILRKAEKSA